MLRMRVRKVWPRVLGGLVSPFGPNKIVFARAPKSQFSSGCTAQNYKQGRVEGAAIPRHRYAMRILEMTEARQSCDLPNGTHVSNIVHF
jgi:hypothetical protein